MKKRILSFAVVFMMVVMCSVNVFATDEVAPCSSAVVTGGLSKIGNGQYEIWGRIQGVREELSIQIELRTTSGSYIDGAFNSGTGPTVSTSEQVNLSPGTYHLHIYGTTPTHTPSQILVVRAS